MEKYDAKTIKSEDFAVEIVNLFKFLRSEKGEEVMSKQILRSGTSIGANIAEANYCGSEADFLNKLRISIKECNETKFWLRLLYKTQYIDENYYKKLKGECTEILAILSSIILTKTKNTKN